MVEILAVDDSPEIRKLERRIFESEGHVIIEAEDGASKLKTATSQLADLIVGGGVRDHKSKDDVPQKTERKFQH